MELRTKTKNTISIVVCVLSYIILQGAMVVGMNLPIANFNGVFMACQFGVCLVMVWTNQKIGTCIALVLMLVSCLSTVRAVVVLHRLLALPGICNTIVYVVCLVLLNRQFRIREKEAIVDFLTGLLNRRGLFRLMQRNVDNNKKFHVIYLDLENFKFVNDNYGHQFGDHLLRIVSERMVSVIGERGTVARTGGDEFVIVLDAKEDAEEVANEVLHSIRKKITDVLNGSTVEYYISAYAGVVSYPKDATVIEELLKCADLAMYEAIKNKQTTACIFTKNMEAYMKRQVELENFIKEGLQEDYFYLVYQPQYKLDEKQLRGFETLLRMKSPQGEIISPAEFIPVAEKGELILAIDDYVLRRAMKEFKPVIDSSDLDLTLSINVSAKNIGNAGFVDKIERILGETGFPAKNLEIEITEYCLVQSVEVTISNIKRLRQMGVQLALDDFGTGYTSLHYLSKMPIDLLKIDKSLIDEIELDRKKREFVDAVISLGHLVGCKVISEGVENEEQIAALCQENCDYIQGYVWGKPLSYEEAKALAMQQKSS